MVTNKVRPIVISFRLTEAQVSQLQDIVDHKPVVNIPSHNRLCRKVITDYLAGRLIYKNKDDALIDYDSMVST